MISPSGRLRRRLVFCLGLVSTVLPIRAASQTSPTVNQVIKGGGRYVAVGTQGLIQTSTDGYGWVTRNSGITDELRGVGYGNGVFVAVGANSEILYSADGVDWNRVAGSGASWPSFNAVTYGAGRFVAVGQSSSSGPIYTSTDGKTWTAALPGAPDSLTSVTYGNGLFVAVGSNIDTSTDGIRWTTNLTIPAFSSVVGFGADTWVILATQFSKVTTVYTSKDGVTWAQGSLG